MRFVRKHLYQYPTALLFALITVWGVYLLFGFFWEDWQGFLVNVGYGLLSTKPSYELLFQDLLFLQIPAIVQVADWFKTAPVFGIWALSIILLYVSLWFHLAIRILSRVTGNVVFIIIFSHLFIWTIVAASLVYVNVTRDSILLVSGSLLLYFDYYVHGNKKSRWLIVLSIFGIMLRVTSGFVALSAMAIFALLFFRSLKKTFNLLKITGGVGIMCLIIVLCYHPGANAYESKVERFEYPIMGRALVPISAMKSKRDSARYIALTTHFLVIDTAQINLGFMEKVVNIPKHRTISVNQEDLSHMSEGIVGSLDGYKSVIFASYLLIFILMVYSSKTTVINVVLFNAYCWIVILGLALKVTMQAHFFVPWMAMTFGVSLFLSLNGGNKIKARQALGAFLLLPILSIIVFKVLNGYANEEEEVNKTAHAYIKKLEILAEHNVIMIWDHYPQLPTGVLERQNLSVLKDCIYLSLYTIEFYPFGQDRCIQKLGFSPLDWRKMNITLNNKRDKISFITEDSSAHFLEYYYRDVYDMNFKLTKDSPVNEVARDLFSFHLEKGTSQ